MISWRENLSLIWLSLIHHLGQQGFIWLAKYIETPWNTINHCFCRLLRYVYRARWYRDDDRFLIYRADLDQTTVGQMIGGVYFCRPSEIHFWMISMLNKLLSDMYCGGYVTVMNLSEQRICCYILNMWKANCRETPDSILCRSSTKSWRETAQEMDYRKCWSDWMKHVKTKCKFH